MILSPIFQRFAIGICLFVIYVVAGQNADSILVGIRNQEFEATEHQIAYYFKKTEDIETKRLLTELEFYNTLQAEYGIYKTKSLDKIEPTFSSIPATQSINLLNLSLYELLYEYDSESQAFWRLKKALDIALENNDRVVVCEILKAISLYYIRLLDITDDQFFCYDRIYQENAYDTTEKEINQLLNFFFRLDNGIHNFEQNEIQQIIGISNTNKILNYRAYASKLVGLYYEAEVKNYNLANVFYKKSTDLTATSHRDVYILNGNRNDYAYFLNNINKSRDAFFYLHQIKENFKGKNYTFCILSKYSNLSNAFAGVKMYDSAYYYKEKSRVLKNKFEQSKHNSIINQLESKEKNKTIQQLEQNKWLYLGLINFVFVLALYSFIRWKKVDNKRRRLTKEKESLQITHEQTIHELSKVKQMVIEDHVVLKNKAKIYLKELIYIKADDHYLELYTSKKKEFIRGKLSEILADLPPNFVKCHRSYIINKNFVKQVNVRFVVMEDHTEIPISRNFRLE